MDFEFDKEIDVLLRQARKGEAVFAAANPPSAHLDADEISAFAENVLPEKAKRNYTIHLADCDSCRKSLSELILLNAENEIVSLPENIINTSPVIPWYQRLFALPNLAYTLGALIVLFGGIIGFMVVQNFDNSKNSEVAQINEESPIANQTYSESDLANSELNINSANTNMAVNSNTETVYTANSMMNSSASANSNTSIAPNKPVVSAPPMKDELQNESNQAVNKEGNNFSVDGATEYQANNGFIAGAAAGRRNQRTQNDPRSGNSANQIPVEPEASSVNNRQVSELPQNNRQSAELRSSPPRKSPIKDDSKKAKTSDAMAAVEEEAASVAGKTFNRRNNVWYDVNYKQQSTINITRGTEKYKKLDKELRRIVENLGGTVVVVWKEKAYRIQ